MQNNYPINAYDMLTLEAQCLHLQSHALSTYRRACARAPTPPRAQDVFPALFSFISADSVICPIEATGSHESFIQTQNSLICGLIWKAMQKSPHIVESLLVPSLLEQRERSQPPLISAQTTQKAPSIKPDTQMPDEGTILEDSTVKKAATSKASKTPQQIAELLLSKETIRIINEAPYVFNGQFFEYITVECLKRLVLENCRNYLSESGKFSTINDIFSFIVHEPTIYQKRQTPDADLLVFNNGVLNLRNRQLYPHSNKFNCYYKIDSDYLTGNTSHPVFDRLLSDISGGDKVLEQRIWEIFGYCLTPDLRPQVFFVFQGVEASGKSTLTRFMESCFNSDAWVALSLARIKERFEASALIGKHLCAGVEIPAGEVDNATSAIIKSITGNEPITADVKYRPHVTFENQAKFVFTTNHPIITKAYDPAFFRRIVSVPFRYTKPPHLRDGDLLGALLKERSSIVYDALEAYFQLRQRNYTFSGNYSVNEGFNVDGESGTSLEEEVAAFLKSHCEFGVDFTAFIEDLYTAICRETPSFGLDLPRFTPFLLEVCHNQLKMDSIHHGGKKRRSSGGNPRATIVGLRLKQLGKEDNDS